MPLLLREMPKSTQRAELGLIDHVRQLLEATATNTRLSKRFLNGLLDSDDWSLIIKLHALIETAMNQLITYAIGDGRVLEIVMRLDASDKHRGKMAFIKAMELLPSEARTFISTLSQLRNDLVHNISKFDFLIQDWIKGMTAQQLSNFTISLNFDSSGQKEFWYSKHKDKFRELHESDLKAIIVFASLAIVYSAIDMEFQKFKEPLLREQGRLKGLIDSYEAGLKQSASESSPKE